MGYTLADVLKHLEKLKVAHGKWELAEGATACFGTCQKCGHRQPAINLKLVRLPFGRGENWVCGVCINNP